MNPLPGRFTWLYHLVLIGAGACLIYFVYLFNPLIMSPDSRQAALISAHKGSWAAIQFKDLRGPSSMTKAGNTNPDTELRLGYRFRQLTEDPNLECQTIDQKLHLDAGAPGVWCTHGAGGALSLYDPQGQKLWQFQLHDKVISKTPLLSARSFLFATKQGYIYALDRMSGAPQWVLPGKTSVSDIFEHAGELFSLEQPSLEQFQWRALDIATGKVKRQSQVFKGTPVGEPTLMPAAQATAVLTRSGKALSINLSDFKIKWQKDLGVEFSSSALYVENSLLVNTTTGFTLSLNATTGDNRWQHSLGTPALNAPVYIPSYDLIAVLTSTGYLHAFERSGGAGRWRFNTHNQSPSQELATFRLNGPAMNKLGLPVSHNGWTLWSPCAQNRICIYSPGQGQLLARVMTRAPVASRPFYFGGQLGVALRGEDGKVQWARFEELNDKGQSVATH